MAEHPIWRGTLRLALVTCPVALYPAHQESGDLHFHLINPETGHRIRTVTVDAETDREVSRAELVRGYEFKKDQYLLLSNEDFENARIESSSVLRIDKFIPVESLDPLYFDSSYYLAPDGENGEDVFVVLREAIRRSRVMALTRVVIARRERALAILPLEDGLVAHTLHEERDLRESRPLFEPLAHIRPDDDMVKLAMQLVARQGGRFNPAADTEDRYEARLRAVIEARLRGQPVEPEPAPEPARGKVVDLMKALKQSLEHIGAPEPAPARRGTRKTPARRRA